MPAEPKQASNSSPGVFWKVEDLLELNSACVPQLVQLAEGSRTSEEAVSRKTVLLQGCQYGVTEDGVGAEGSLSLDLQLLRRSPERDVVIPLPWMMVSITHSCLKFLGEIDSPEYLALSVAM